MSVAVVPHPPLLVPGLGGATDPLAALRTRCVDLVRSLEGPVVMLGDGPETAWYASVSGTFAPWGADVRVGDGAGRPPLSLLVGAWLCQRAGTEIAGAWAVEEAFGLGDADRPDPRTEDATSLLVIADGTAARGEKPPAGVHPDAERTDRELERMLCGADTAGLRAFEPDPALQCQGAPAFRALGRLVADQRWSTSDVTQEAPFGVAYFTARWAAKT